MTDETIFNKNLLGETMLFYKNFMRYLKCEIDIESEVAFSKITFSEFFFLSYLEDKRKATYYQLSQELPYNNSFISKTIKNLEHKGLITREILSNKKIIRLSDSSKEVLAFRKNIRNKFLKSLNNQGLSQEELETFYTIMSKFSKILSEECE